MKGISNILSRISSNAPQGFTLDSGIAQLLLHGCKFFFEPYDFRCLFGVEYLEAHVQAVVVEYFVRYAPNHFNEFCVSLLVSQ